MQARKAEQGDGRGNAVMGKAWRENGVCQTVRGRERGEVFMAGKGGSEQRVGEGAERTKRQPRELK